jgi:hypothetical protein
MKKILILTALLTGVCTFAQEVMEDEKLILKSGTVNLGGNLNFGTSNQDFSSETNQNINKNTLFRIQPRFGYFVVNNVEIGIALDYTHVNQNSLQQRQPVTESENTTTTFGIIPYIRGYKSINKNLLLFVQGEIGYSTIQSEFQNNSRNISTGSGNEFRIGIKPGITYFISKRMALEASLGGLTYNNSNQDFESRNDDNTFNQSDSSGNSFNFSINPSDFLFGLSIYL